MHTHMHTYAHAHPHKHPHTSNTAHTYTHLHTHTRVRVRIHIHTRYGSHLPFLQVSEAPDHSAIISEGMVSRGRQTQHRRAPDQELHTAQDVCSTTCRHTKQDSITVSFYIYCHLYMHTDPWLTQGCLRSNSESQLCPRGSGVMQYCATRVATTFTPRNQAQPCQF